MSQGSLKADARWRKEGRELVDDGLDARCKRLRVHTVIDKIAVGGIDGSRQRMRGEEAESGRS